MSHYNLDMIIAVGYRVKSQAAQAVLKQAVEKYTFFLTWQRKRGEK